MQESGGVESAVFAGRQGIAHDTQPGTVCLRVLLKNLDDVHEQPMKFANILGEFHSLQNELLVAVLIVIDEQADHGPISYFLLKLIQGELPDKRMGILLQGT